MLAAASLAAVVALASSSALAQGGDQKPAEQRQQQAGEPAKDFAEAERVLSGPAGQPECVWLGRRVVGRLWEDDLDTAFRHLDLYDRFGCPGGHVQSAFRCVVRQGNPDRKANENPQTRVHACWLNPALQPAAAAAPAGSTGATTR
jgi:hypothetical protein